MFSAERKPHGLSPISLAENLRLQCSQKVLAQAAFREEVSVSYDLTKMSPAEGVQQHLASSAAIDDEHRQDPDYLRS